MYRVKDPVFAMAESFFLDGGSRLHLVNLRSLTCVSEWRSVACSNTEIADVGRNTTGVMLRIFNAMWEHGTAYGPSSGLRF